MGISFDKTQSYDMALTGVAIMMVIGIPLALYAARKPLIRA